MIFLDKKIAINKDTATINSPISLYRGDGDIKVRFVIEDTVRYTKKTTTNIIETTTASHAQLIIKIPDNNIILTDIEPTDKGTVIFLITRSMIDDIPEIGAYDIQIRLFDEEKTSRITIPPVHSAMIIREPLAIGSEADSGNTGGGGGNVTEGIEATYSNNNLTMTSNLLTVSSETLLVNSDLQVSNENLYL